MDKPPEQTQLRILLLEDVPTDAELTEHTLRAAGLSFTAKRVDTREAFIRALEEFHPDIVLADYKLPSFDGGSAVKIAKLQYPDIPVVIVTGAVGEETAVELLKLGARDYILKDRLARLGTAVRRVLAEEQDTRARKAAEEALRESEARYKRITEGITDYQYTVRIENGRAVETTQSPACVTVTGYEAKELAADPYLWIQMVEPEDRELVTEHVRQILAGKDVPPMEHRIIRKDGESRWVSDTTILFKDASGKLLSYDGVIEDITERRKLEGALKEAAERNRAIMETANDAIICMKPGGAIHLWNLKAEEMFGYTAGEAIGRNLHQLIVPERHHAKAAEGLRQFSTTGTGPIVGKTLELTAWRKGRVEFPIELSISPLNIRGEWHATGIIRDITARKKSEEMIFKQANFDALTGLPNRHMFHDRLEQEIRKSHRDGLRMPLLSIDLDKFKEVNDTLGHSMGDILLVEAARRIRNCVYDIDTVARLDGDEFAVILSELDNVGSIERVAGNILQRLAEPFQLGSETVYVSASIGITLYPDDATGMEGLLKNADQAMHAAKEKGRNRFSYFMQTMQDAAQARLRLVNDLRGALAGNQLLVYFQPIVDMATGNINKAEALVRWQHPERGLVGPAEFIPLAEETGLIFEIGDWVFHESMRWAKRWRALHNPALQISVNKSPLQFYKDGDDHTAWLSYLRELDLPGQSLAIEITEGLLMDANALISGELLSLRDAGIQVSLDDFGTGYSSLSYLKKFHIDYLKIDQSFVRDMVTDPNDMALSEAIIVMAHKLGIKVVAEGVETQKQLNLLALAGCDYAQGYLYSRPVPPEEFEELLKQGYL